MIDSLEKVTNLLKSTILEGQQVIQLGIPQSDDYAFAIEVNRENGIAAWDLMRANLPHTQRWPILVSPQRYPDFTNETWEQQIIESDYFCRFEYEQEASYPDNQDVSPKSIITRSQSFEIDDFLGDRDGSFWDTVDEDEIDSLLERELERIRERFGSSPERSQLREIIDSQVDNPDMELEKWLFHWELQNFDDETAILAPDTNYFDWYEPDNQKRAIILLPTANSWDSLAYINWYGGCGSGSDGVVAFLKWWHQRYEAELVCHYGTMLGINVGRLPSTPEEAFELAAAHDAIAPCTIILPGVSLRDHARTLLKVNRWFLHERP